MKLRTAIQSVQLPSNKKFGLFFSFVFAIISAYFLYINFVLISTIFFSLGLIFFILALIKPNSLLPFNKIWMNFGLLLGSIVSPIIMGIIFFGLFTPIGFLMRIFGRDELRLKVKLASSYWKIRDPQADVSQSFKNQF